MDEFEEQYRANMLAAEKMAEENRKVEERSKDDPDYEWEQRQIRYMEQSDDDVMF